MLPVSVGWQHNDKLWRREQKNHIRVLSWYASWRFEPPPLKHISQIGNLPQFFGVKNKKYLKPPPSMVWQSVLGIKFLFKESWKKNMSWGFSKVTNFFQPQKGVQNFLEIPDPSPQLPTSNNIQVAFGSPELSVTGVIHQFYPWNQNKNTGCLVTSKTMRPVFFWIDEPLWGLILSIYIY